MPKIAIVHEWLTSYAGSERVLEQLLSLYPDATLFAVADFLAPADRHFLHGRIPHTTFVQRFPRFELDSTKNMKWSVGQIRGPRELPIRVLQRS